MSARETAADAIVIGAGLAGSALAFELQKRGLTVIVLEALSAHALAASGNPAGIWMPHATAQLTSTTQFYLRSLRELLSDPLLAECRLPQRQNGAIQLAHSPASEKRLRSALEYLPSDLARWCSAAELSAIAGTHMACGGLFFPQAGMLYPRRLTELRLQGPRINVIYEQIVHSARWQPDAKTWRLGCQNGKHYESRYVLLAQASAVRSISAAAWLPVIPVRGQLLYLQAGQALTELNCPVSYEGYISPCLPPSAERFQSPGDAAVCQVIGATFEHWNTRTELIPAQHQRLYEMARRTLPALPKANVETNPGRVSFRSSSPDRFLLAGRLPHLESLQTSLDQNPHQMHAWLQRWPRVQAWPQTGISLAHASRGILTSGLTARLVVADLLDEQLSPADQQYLAAGQPTRYLQRNLRRHGKLLPVE
ncbi:MAG: FAD-dependent 5-carboxymethylaminomethyl-2-thiouridine(34) oxidoreductase MnmC [Leptospiraceae bacterium]|nr:FAD-dependent 5-carboxymethylaminomethyl-2-thiouridine(34) oxidoreductase MnmC [Leptospiraceae bacterium]